MSRGRFSGRAVMSLILMVISVMVVLIAMKWPFKAALFPVSIGIAVFILSLIALILILAGKGESGKKGGIDFQVSSEEEVDPETATKRTVAAFAWIIGFFVLILVVGFPIAVVLFVFLYLKFQGKERWPVVATMTLISGAFFWGLFVWILDTILPEGLAFQGLRAIGIGG